MGYYGVIYEYWLYLILLQVLVTLTRRTSWSVIYEKSNIYFITLDNVFSQEQKIVLMEVIKNSQRTSTVVIYMILILSKDGSFLLLADPKLF